jgi:predicted HTH domain antitoxin
MKLAFELEIPDGAINTDMGADLVRSVKEQAVLRLYADGRVTVGEASEMLGLTRIQYLDLLERSGVGFRVDLDDEDFRILRKLREDHAAKNPQ